MAAVAPLEVVMLESRQEPRYTLFEITDHLSALYDTLEGTEENAEYRAELEAEIDRFVEAEIRKVDSVASYLAHCESQQAFAADEIKRLQSRKQTWSARQARLELSIQRVLEISGKTKLDGRTSSLSLKKCPPSVEVLDQQLVPAEYIRTKTETSVDKSAAKSDLVAGVEIPGLRLITDRKSVVRK